MKRVLALLAVVALIAAGCARRERATARAAELVPSNALAYVEVSFDPPLAQKRDLQKVCARFKDLGKGDCGLEKLARAFFADLGLHYDSQVAPWIGRELAFAVLPPARMGGDPLTALLVEARDPSTAGDALRQAQASGRLEAAFRVVGSFVVLDGQDGLANRTAALRQVQAAGSKGALADEGSFTDAVGKVHSPRLALGWWNLADTLDLAGRSLALPGLGSVGDEVRRGKGGGDLAFALYADAGSLVLEGVTGAEGTAPQPAGRPKLTEGLPAATLAAVTTFGLGPRLRRDLSEAAGTDPGLRARLDDLVQTRGLDLGEDVLSWMGGEAVIAAGAFSREGIPDTGLVVEPTDPARAAAGVAKIKAAVEAELEAPLAPVPIGGVTAWFLPEPIVPGLQPGMALFPDRFVVASSPEYLSELSKPSSPGFGATPEYRQAPRASGGSVPFQAVVRLRAVRNSLLAILTPEERTSYGRDIAPWADPLRTLLLRVLPGDAGRFEIRVTTG